MLLQIPILILTIISICPIATSSDCDYVLYNKDFEYGTYRIQTSGVYCLGENIDFGPHPATADDPNKYGAWFPYDEHEWPGSQTHDGGGYALGFFSAICIECSDVIIDLKGYEIQQSKPFYLQQRWFNCIEIQTAAFNFGQGPANFGETVERIHNIRIMNGILGRSSHNGIHGFDVVNVHISDLRIHTFEVAGIQMNGFKDVTIRNVDIGPSSTQVPFWGYYSHGRFSLNGFELINEEDIKYIRFQGNRELTIKQIYLNLRKSLDIAFRAAMGLTTDEDKKDPLYDISIEMYRNHYGLPDGSSLYGMIFNSKGLAVQGFGDSENRNEFEGDSLYIENVNINGLHLNMNEIPALYLDKCEGHLYNDDGTISITPVLGRFGDLFDFRRTQPYDQWNYIDTGFYSYDELIYGGNPLSDAQIALNIFSEPFETNWGIQQTEDTNRGKETLFRWATHNNDPKYNALPQCARFACNADAMFHTNKGIIGIRLDSIENVIIKNINIENLINETPLGSLACGIYEGPTNGQAQPRGLKKEGVMGTNVRGISIVDGGMVELYENIQFNNLVSNNGNVIGIHIMNKNDYASIYIHDFDKLQFNELIPGAIITQEMHNHYANNGVTPYPNNFYVCNIRAESLSDRENDNYPYYYTSIGKGFIYPKGVAYCTCDQLYYDNDGQRSTKKRKL